MTNAIAEFLENRNTSMVTGRFKFSEESKFVGVYYTPTVCIDDEKNEFGIVYVAESDNGNNTMLWAATYMGFQDCNAMISVAIDAMLKAISKP